MNNIDITMPQPGQDHSADIRIQRIPHHPARHMVSTRLSRIKRASTRSLTAGAGRTGTDPLWLAYLELPRKNLHLSCRYKRDAGRQLFYFALPTEGR
jgi:hypothetical protein